MSPNTHVTLSMSLAGRKHKENQDRALVRVIPWMPTPIYLIAVADGISGSRYGGSVARFLIELHLQVDELFRAGSPSLTEQFNAYCVQLKISFNNEFAEFEEMHTSGATLSAAVVYGEDADCFWCGDSPIYITRQMPAGMPTEMISRPDKNGKFLIDHFGGDAPFVLKHKHISLSPGDIVTITSDGVVHDAELLSRSYSKIGFNQSFLNEVRDIANRSPNSDDISLVACKKI